MLHSERISAQARDLLAACRAAGLWVACAESCTGGLVAAAITEIPGSSDIFERGFVTYSNLAKVEMLGVSENSLDAYGAVSRSVALEMAQGALARSRADVSVAVTGVAGPGGGSDEKPVGLVHFGCVRRAGGVRHVERRFGPLSRAEIRAAAVEQALALLLESASAPAGEA
ncbi:CinA family protein [Methylocystis bryophila]|uniref:Damage-inducible protein CinA n=1 Tax=Methylocystis bryophila TaxID=655015 RepID=A0A1W6MZD4_9HYPH|nr:CinA family protein [Methylocystis bryophila]ARN82942.1 damage-inducible protein CinA [Methylocystis bryophila]BDV39228.1 competence damage-inducible protein A [Methylocystis bryophila]